MKAFHNDKGADHLQTCMQIDRQIDRQTDIDRQVDKQIIKPHMEATENCFGKAY